MTGALDADSVTCCLSKPGLEFLDTLDALETHEGAWDSALSQAAARALTAAVLDTTAEHPPQILQRIGLLRGRLMAQAQDFDGVCAAILDDGKLLSEYQVTDRIFAKPAPEITREDVHTYGCLCSHFPAAESCGYDTPAETAAGMDTFSYIRNQSRAESEPVVVRICDLALDLLQDLELSKQAICGLIWVVYVRANKYQNICLAVYEGAIDRLCMHLRALGPAQEWLRAPKTCAAQSLAYAAFACAVGLSKGFSGRTARPDLATIVSSGVFQMSVETVEVFAANGIAGLTNTHHNIILCALAILRNCSGIRECAASIKGISKALKFCLANSLLASSALRFSTGSYAAAVCCAIFGRDESENAEFSFTQDLVDQLVDNWSLTVNNPSYPTKPSPDKMLTLELCISDKHKPLLLSNSSFLPYLISGLFLDPTHPRGNLDGEIKAWNQQMHSECFAQLALFPDAREMLRGDAAACEALQKVKELGSSAKSREYAEAALLALSDHQLQLRIDEQQHVMLSCESPHNHCCEAMQPRDGAVCGLDADNWSHQSIVQRINDSLINRGYATWYDLSNMKGSTMDAMSDAIEGSAVMLYTVSLQYKESANCRLEANYAFQERLDMIPLKMDPDYHPQGWLGLMLGTRLWYAMWDADQDDDIAFETRLNPIVREIGRRGQNALQQGTPAVKTQPSGDLPHHFSPPASVVARVHPTPVPAPASGPTPASTPFALQVATADRASLRAPTPGLASSANQDSTDIEIDISSRLALERDSLMQQVQDLSAQLASFEQGSATTASRSLTNASMTQLSEAYYLERAERQMERERVERQAERERAERHEARVILGFSASVCTCGIGAAIVGTALLQSTCKR